MFVSLQIKNVRIKLLITIILLLNLGLACGRSSSNNYKLQHGTLLNFAHLDYLFEKIRINNREVGIIHIYSNAPDYAWTNAPGEGIACVDDAARAAVLYLRQYKSTRNEDYFLKSKLLLRFILTMQAPNGLFYNFIHRDYRINKTRKNSVNKFDFWTARAVWALGEGYSILKDRHPIYADSLYYGLMQVFPWIDVILKNYPQVQTLSGKTYPTWLINRYASDATSELLLGLTAYYNASNDQTVKPYLEKLSSGLILMQRGDWRHAPYGAHLSFPGIWHAWGNAQTEALAMIGTALHDSSAAASAEKEARWFYSRLLITGWKSAIFTDDTTRTKIFPQIAYGVRPVALGLLNLYKSTQNDDYAVLAGLAGSWFFGNNPAKKIMVNLQTGLVFDGIENARQINLNSGAESTIEALLTLQSLQMNPLSRKYLFYKRESGGKIQLKIKKAFVIYRIFSDQAANRIVLSLNLNDGRLSVMSDPEWKTYLKEN